MSAEAERIRASFGDKLASLETPVEQLRSEWEDAVRDQPLQTGVRIEPAPLDGLEHEWVVPPIPSWPGVLLWVHGGGFNSGSPRTGHPFAAQLALTTARPVAWYLADMPPSDPRASPLFADLAGLPPLAILVGSDEVLLDDACTLASRARAARVHVELTVAEGMWHVWPAWAPDLPEANDALSSIAAFLQAR